MVGEGVECSPEEGENGPCRSEIRRVAVFDADGVGGALGEYAAVVRDKDHGAVVVGLCWAGAWHGAAGGGDVVWIDGGAAGVSRGVPVGVEALTGFELPAVDLATA